MGLHLLSWSLSIVSAYCHTDLILRCYSVLISDKVVSSHCFFSVFQVLLKLAFANCRLIRHILSSFPWAVPPCPSPPGGYPMAEGTFNRQVYFSAAVCSELKKEEENNVFGPRICDVRCKPATPRPALLFPLPVLTHPGSLWALQMYPVPSSTRPAVPLFPGPHPSSPPSAGLC